MEDDKLAAYYDELTRKGGGAARFKQGLGFSSSSSQNDTVPARGSALPITGSSFLSGFVKASAPSSKPISESQKQAQLHSIQDKLSKKQEEHKSRGRVSSRRRRSRSRSRSRSRDRYSRRRSRSRSRDRYRGRRGRSRSREKESRRRSEGRTRRSGSTEEGKKGKGENGGGLDYAKVIHGYDAMTPAERVKAKMKLQLSRTAENDETIGKGSGWERFDFDKDAPLDDEEEIEAAEDDATIVKHMGQSFRFSAVEARKEADIQAAHDEAMFGAPSIPQEAESESDAERERSKPGKNTEAAPSDILLNEQVLTMPKGSWRDRVRKA